MAKFIKNASKGVISLGAKNFIPGEPGIEVTEKEAAHPMIAAYIKAGKLQLIENDEPATVEDKPAKAKQRAKKAGE